MAKLKEFFKNYIESKKKQRERRNVIKAKKNNKNNYLSAKILKRKMQNSQMFINIKSIDDNGLINLKTNQFALMYKAYPIDLSLTSEQERGEKS